MELNLMSSKKKTVKKVKCYGVTNRIQNTNDTEYVVFLDYDHIEFEVLNKELQSMIKKWDLGWTYIIKTDDDMYHWHVICPSIVNAYEYLGILWDSTCDMPYKKSFFVLREKSLRISSKNDGRKTEFPKMHGTLETESNRAYSTAHLEFLKQYYSAKIPLCDRYKETEIEMVEYKTAHLKQGDEKHGID